MKQREAAISRLRSCEERLSRYRAALEAGADPVIVPGWIAEVRAERLRHEIDGLASGG